MSSFPLVVEQDGPSGRGFIMTEAKAKAYGLVDKVGGSRLEIRK